PKLQGVMGREYARVDGEPEAVAVAIAEHYLPRFADDALPQTEVGVALSLADKFDAIGACFAAGLAPSGSQDPYALRRQALGILRIIEQQRLNLRLGEVAAKAREQLPASVKAAADGEPARVLDFFRDRLYQTSLDRGYRYDLVNAALASGFDDVLDFRKRLDVLAKLSAMPQWPALVTVVERTFNIGKKCAVEGAVNEALLTEPAEQALWAVFQKHQAEIAQLVESGRYEEASLRYHNAFAEPVHVFFDKVFVNVEDERVRNNRLLMLKQINRLFSARMADLSQIVPPDAAK
ncbi:MAG: glycine--tRNA ligase subunit beta, partial [Planctomycetes bacterium]|nr:glycine--tRNA ligase subunit beta [Planctomycetota bacterium]